MPYSRQTSPHQSPSTFFWNHLKQLNVYWAVFSVPFLVGLLSRHPP